MYSPARKRGNLAEDIVSRYLENNGYKIEDRNYLKKWGEIDIVVSKKKIIHFVEVKSAFFGYYFSNYENNPVLWKIDVSHETDVSCETDKFDPTWNMTNLKKKRLSRAIKSYISENFNNETPYFQIDLISVLLDNLKKIAYISEIDNIILDG